MSNSVLQKALNGDIYALVQITKAIENNDLYSHDIKLIINDPSDRSKLTDHHYYLRACCYTFGVNELPKNIDLAKELLERLIKKNNSFALHLLTKLSQDENIRLSCHQQALELGNPLAIMTAILTKQETNLATNLTWLSSAFSSLSHSAQKACLDSVLPAENDRTAADWHQLAHFYEVINWKTHMYEAFHQVIILDGDSKGNYIEELVQAINRDLASKKLFFNPTVNADFVKKTLDKIIKKITPIEVKITTDSAQKIDDKTRNILRYIYIDLKNIEYILEYENFAEGQRRELLGTFQTALDLSQKCKKKIDVNLLLPDNDEALDHSASAYRV